jgi:hypothetical protein
VPAGGDSSGYTVQFSKPKEADSVKLLAFPKPGAGFDRWWDHALDSISASTSFCTEAYRWALITEKPETTFSNLADSGAFIRLDALLLAALMECIPGDTHLLRQEIKKAKTEQRMKHLKNITGRQVLWMTHRYFAMNEKDKEMTDTARLQKVCLVSGDLQQFIYRWDERLTAMTKRPPDDDLVNLFVLQLDVNLPKTHGFYVEYLFWYNRPRDDPIRSYEGIWSLVHDWVRRKRDQKNRREALREHVPGLGAPATPFLEKGGDAAKLICFSWRDTGKCAKKDAGTCQYNHPQNSKGKSKGKGGGK